MLSFLSEFIGPHQSLSWCMQFWPVLVFAWLGGWVGTVASRHIALLYDIVDRPDHLVKTHAQPIPYLGGVGLFVGLIAGVLVGMSFRNIQPDPFRDLLPVVMGAALALIVGVTDDIHNLGPRQKLLGQMLAATILVLAGWWPRLDGFLASLGCGLHPYWITLIEIMMVYVVVLVATNSINLLDGIDGLCGGVTLITALGMLLLTVHLSTWATYEGNDPVCVILVLSLVGALLGFLALNRPPAKIFMGDAGSLLIGFWVASLILIFFRSSLQMGFAALMMFGLPLLDTSVAVVRRKLNKRPLFASDRGHLYDQMMDRGLTLGQTLLFCYGWSMVYSLTGVLVGLLSARLATLLYILAVAASWTAIWAKGFLKMDGLRGANSVDPEPAE